MEKGDGGGGGEGALDPSSNPVDGWVLVVLLANVNLALVCSLSGEYEPSRLCKSLV